MTETELNELCKKYQKMLKIQDWDIDVSLVEQRTMEGRDGTVDWSRSFRRAHVRIPKPDTWSSNFFHTKQDMRLSLLHELVHIVFAFADPGYEKSDVKQQLWETAIDSVAQAILAAEDEANSIIPKDEDSDRKLV